MLQEKMFSVSEIAKKLNISQEIVLLRIKESNLVYKEIDSIKKLELYDYFDFLMIRDYCSKQIIYVPETFYIYESKMNLENN